MNASKPRGFRAHVTLDTELVVCHALMALAVTGTEPQAEASVAALYELGYGDAAAHLDSALAVRRELEAVAAPHSLRVTADDGREAWSPTFRAMYDEAVAARNGV